MDPERSKRLQRLAQLLKEARDAGGGWPVTRSMEKAGVSKAQWYALTNATVERPQAATLASFERKFGWPSGSISRFLDGGPEPGEWSQGIMDISMPDDQERLLVAVERELLGSEGRDIRRRLLRMLADTDRDED